MVVYIIAKFRLNFGTLQPHSLRKCVKKENDMTQELITTQDQTLRNSVKSEVSAPSIGSSAMLVDFSASVWTGRKKDKRASDDVTEANFAASGMASVHKKLLGDCQELEAIQKFVANGRNRHSAMTMPWSDTGLRLLPTAQYFKYHQAMTEMINEYWRLVAVFKAVS